MQETLSLFMFLLQVQEKSEEAKQVQWHRQQNT